MSKEYIVGIDIGGTKCALTLAKRCEISTPDIIEKVKFPTAKKSPYSVLEEFMSELDAVLAKHALNYNDIHAMGISCGGPLDPQKGIIMSPPNLPTWDNIPVCEYFESRTSIPCKLQNDANACAVAEWKYGAGRGLESMVFITFGTGFGAGLILDGRLYSGYTGNAGDIGHVRIANDGPIGYGKAGSCEGFCSGGGLAQLGAAAMSENGKDCRLYKECNGDPSKVTAKIIGDLADDGDEICINIYKKCGEMLGYALAIICDLLDVQRIILGGIFMRSSHLLTEKMYEVLNVEALRTCEISAAGLGENVGDYAALSIAEM